MSSSIASIGAHCALQSCNLNDFLPIRCACDRLFCRDHVHPDAHACPVAAQQAAASSASAQGERKTRERGKCGKEGCARPSLESAVQGAGSVEDGGARTPARCAGCGGCYCAYHRDPTSHSCTPTMPVAPPKNEAARQLLADNFPSSAVAGLPKPATRPKRSANKQVALMQMRHRALPADPKDRPSVNVPVGERLHVEVETAQDLDAAKAASGQSVYWFRKGVSTGRALDMLAGRLGVGTANPLQLLKYGAEGETALRNDAPLAEQVEDGDVVCLGRRPST